MRTRVLMSKFGSRFKFCRLKSEAGALGDVREGRFKPSQITAVIQ